MDCLSEIIGITNTDCPCIIDGLEPSEIEAIRRSTSGLYLDELEGGLSMRGVSQIDSCQDFAQMSLGARDVAVKKLYADIMATLNQKYKTSKGSFTGSIGRPSYTANINVSNRYQYLRLRPLEFTDALLKVSAIRLIVDRVIDTTVKIIQTQTDGNQGTEIFSQAVTTGANTYTNIPLGAAALELPLVVNGEIQEYYVVWDRGTTEAKPKDLKISCNCGGGVTGFDKYVHVQGGEMDNIDMLGIKTKGGFTQGLSLDVDIRCVPGKLICREYDNDNAIAVTMAWATMYKAGEILIESVMGSAEVNRYTMMNREYLWGKRNHFRKEYDSRIMYLSTVIDVSSSDCFICRESKMIKAGIFS